MPVDLLANIEPSTTRVPVDLLAGVPEEESNVLSWRKPQPASVWERVKAIFPEDSAAEAAKAKNALAYSQMLGISPGQAYEFHDEISRQFRDKTVGEKIVTEKKGAGGVVQAGWESSIAGMMFNEKVPKPFESVNQAETWIHGMVAMGIDLPFFMAGYGLGGGTLVSGMAGAFGFHSGLRKMLVDRYTKGEVKGAADMFQRVGNAAKETVKGQIVGGFTGGVKVMAPTAFTVLAPGLETPAAWTMMSEIATMTAAGKLIEGQLPTAKDFVDTAAILLTMHVGTRGYESARARIPEVKAKLQEVFIESGAHPKEILSEIVREREVDPQEDILDVIDRVNAGLKAVAPEAKVEAAKEEIAPPEQTSQARVAPEATGETSIKNATVDAERAARGLPPIETPITERPKNWREQVEAKVDSGEIDPRAMAEKINNLVELGEKPPVLNDEGNHALLYDKKQLQNEHKAVQTEIDNLSEPAPQGKKSKTGAMYWPESDEARLAFDLMKSELKTAQTKSVPDWFRDISKKHKLSATEAVTIMDKYLAGKKPLTDRQAGIFADIVHAAQGEVNANPAMFERMKLGQEGFVEGKVDAASLQVGDELIRKGEKFKVTGKDEDGFLTIKDGETFRVAPDDVLPFDSIKRTGGQTQGDPARLADLEVRRSAIEDALDANEHATKAIGTEQGRALQSRQDMMNEDYSIAAMIRRAKEDGVAITPEIRGKYEKLSKKIEKAQENLRNHNEKAVADTLAKTVKQIQNEEGLSQRKQKREYKKEELDAEFDGLIKEFNKTIGGQLNVGIDPAGVKILIELTRNRIRKGMVAAEDIVDSIYVALTNTGIELSKRDIRDAISQYGVTKEMSKEDIAVKLREAKRQMQLLSALEDAKTAISPARSGLQRDPASDRVRELQREVKQAMRETGIQTARSPEQQWKTSLDAVKTRLKNSIADLVKRMETGKPEAKKAGIQYDEKATELKRIRDKIQEVLDFAEGKKEQTPLPPEQRIRMATVAVEKSIAEYERRITEVDLSAQKKGTATPETPALKALRAERDLLKDLYKTLKDEAKPKKSADQIALESFRKRTEQSIAEYERRLAEGDFSKKAKKEPPTLGEGELRLQYELDKLKKEYTKAAINDRLAQRGFPIIVKDSIIESINLIKAIKSSYDVSAPGRQGFFAFISHPVKGFKNLPEMLRALGSEEAAYRIETEISKRPNAKLYKDAGVSLTERKGSGSKIEEIYRSRWGQLIPGIPASERAFVSFLNLMRVDLFDTMHKSAFSNRRGTPEELKGLGDYVNQATGRGTLKGYENALQGIGTFLWAPKLVLSRFQMVLGTGLWPGGGRTTATRIAVAKEYARILGSLTVIYAVNDLLGTPTEDDPRSSDFGKIRIGNTRIDVLAGVSQATVFMSRVASGETKGLKTGFVMPIRGDYVPYAGTTTWDVISNFLRTKLTPALGLAINLVSGKDLVGNKVTLYDIPEEALVPLAIMDIYDAMEEEGIPSGLALGTLGMFGVGIQTHEQTGARR